MRRHIALLACALVGVAPTMAMPLSGAQATTSRTPSIVGVAAQRPQNQGAAGVWASTEISLIQYRNVTTGTNAPTSGTRIELDLSHPGRYTYSALLQVTSYSCTDSLFAEETGKAVVAGGHLTLAPGTSRFTSRDNCVAKFNYSKPGSLAKRTYQWKVDRLQRGTKLCLRNNSAHGGSGCYWRDKPETAPTADAAGATWARRHVSTNATLWGVSCRAGGRTCLAGGDEGAILTSADGGATWVNATRPDFDENIKAIHCPRAGACVATTPDSTLLGGDGGKFKARSTSAWLLGIDCTGSACVAVGNGGSTATSADGGATWTLRKTGLSNQLNSISCPTARLCVAVGGSWDEQGIILTSADGGASWTRRLTDTHDKRFELDGVSCPTPRQCVAVGHGPYDGIVLTSADGGATWAAHAPGIDNILEGNPLHSIACPGAGRCVAVGDQGTILTSADTGATWAGQIAAGGDRLTPLRSVSCAAAHACVAVGERGVILQLRV